MKSRAEVVAMVRARIRLRHFSLSTEDSYGAWVGRYYDHCLQLERDLDPEKKAESFLTYLATDVHVSARTQNQALAAVLFLYKDVLDHPLGEIDALRAKRYFHERTAPSRDQIRTFRAAVRNQPHVPAILLVDLLYGCGLRVSEPIALRVKDILWEENQLVVRAGKGTKDRRVPIPQHCVGPLRDQVATAKLVWDEDRRDHPEVGVTLPFQLSRKYRSAPFSWQWFWVFPAANHCDHPKTGERVRYHLLHDNLQRAVRAAAIKVSLEGLITPHVLRHAYATHSREQIEALRLLMGHNSIETTAGYRHPVIASATNPLDDLLN
jgi:integrase